MRCSVYEELMRWRSSGKKLKEFIEGGVEFLIHFEHNLLYLVTGQAGLSFLTGESQNEQRADHHPLPGPSILSSYPRLFRTIKRSEHPLQIGTPAGPWVSVFREKGTALAFDFHHHINTPPPLLCR